MSRNKKKPDGPSPHDLLRLVQETEGCGALNDDYVRSLVELYVLCPEDRDLRAQIDERLRPFALNHQVNPDPLRPYPDPDFGLHLGDILIGTIHESGLRYRIPLPFLVHTLIVGPTGQGKTNLVYHILSALYTHVPALLVTVKPEGRLLAPPQVADVVINLDELKLALFEPPPGMGRTRWAKQVLDLFCSAYELQFSRVLLNRSMDTLNSGFDAYSGAQGDAYFPTFQNVLDCLRPSHSKYKESGYTAMDGFLRATDDIFNASQGMSLERLLTGHTCVLNIAGIVDERAARFVVDWFMAWLRTYYEINGPHDGSPQFVLVLDDAHRFLSAKNERDALSPIAHQYLLARQAGLRIVAVSQCPSDLAPAVLSQSGIVIQVGSLSYQRDLDTMGSTFGLAPRDRTRLLANSVGEFIAHENLNRCHKTFGGVVDLFPQPATPVTEADRKRILQSVLATLPHTPGLLTAQVMGSAASQTSGVIPARTPQISQNALALATDVLAHPFDFLSDHYARLTLQGGAAHRAKQELVNLGWVKELSIPRRGRAPVLLEPLPLLAQKLQRPLPSWGKGSFLHRFIQERVARRLKRMGYSAIAFEQFYGSKAVDVVATDAASGLHGFEATVSLGNVVDNLEKDFMVQPGFVLLTVVCLSSSDERQIQRAIKRAPALQSLQRKIAVDRVCRWL